MDSDMDLDTTQDPGFSRKDMISRGVLFMLVAHSKKTTIKRADFSKNVTGMSRAKPSFVKELLEGVQKKLGDVFGIRMFGLNDLTKEWGSDLARPGWTSFLLASKMKALDMPSRLLNSSSPSLTKKQDYQAAVDSVLYVILTTTLMSSIDDGVGMKENLIWHVIETLQLESILRLDTPTDLAKFLKTEFVATHYLRMEDPKQGLDGETLVRYFWGPRAEMEYSKAEIIVAASKMLNLDLQEFTTQCNTALEEETEAKAIFAGYEAYKRNSVLSGLRTAPRPRSNPTSVSDDDEGVSANETRNSPNEEETQGMDESSNEEETQGIENENSNEEEEETQDLENGNSNEEETQPMEAYLTNEEDSDDNDAGKPKRNRRRLISSSSESEEEATSCETAPRSSKYNVRRRPW